MTKATTRLDLYIDLFDLEAQHARVLPGLRPPQLITAILQEFQEVQVLGSQAELYQLERREGGQRLDLYRSLGEQGLDKAHLRLVEIVPPIPAGAHPPSQLLYLREERDGHPFCLHWLPAIVGRSTESSSRSEPVAVDLTRLPTAMRISRRHLQILEEGGQYFVQTISDNPASILRAGGNESPLQRGERQPLHPDEAIRLERADVTLRFLVRGRPPVVGPVAAEDGDAAEAD